MSLTEEYKISKVKMKNYRQYFGEQDAPFAYRDKGFSIFLGENGEGKSNLLNAINWCLFKKEPHRRMNKHQPIINTKYLNELEEGKLAEMYVQVELEKGNEKYRISRTLKGIKHQLEYEEFEGTKFIKITQHTDEPVPVGFEILEDMCSAAFVRSVNNGPFEDLTQKVDLDVLISELLPEGLSEFFILDGEFLEKLFDRFERVEEGIKQISQLNLLDNSIQDIEKISSRIPPGLSSDIDKLTKQINLRENIANSLDEKGNKAKSERLMWKFNEDDDDEYYHQSGQPLIDDLNHEIKQMQNKIKDLGQQLGTNNTSNIKTLQESESAIERQFNEHKGHFDTIHKNYLELLIKKGPNILLKDALENSNQIIENEVEKGSLPSKIKVIFTEDLLHKGECVCGSDLHGDDNPKRMAVQKRRDDVSKDVEMDIAVYLRYDNQNILKNYNKLLETFDYSVEQLKSEDEEIQRLNSQLKGIRDKMKNVGGQTVAKLIEDQDYLVNAIKEREYEIGQLVEQLTRNKEQIVDFKKQLSTLQTKDKKAKRVIHNMNVWTKTLDTLKNVRDELKLEIKTRVQEKTTEIFKQIMWKDEFEKIIIDSQYNLKLLNSLGYDAMQDLSAGEKLFLALSFIAAIRDITGYRFPLIIDTPLGKISGTPRTLLATKLPYFLPNSQLTLLTTDTEYIAPIPNIDTATEGKSFKQILNDTINTSEFRIKFNKKDSTSTIIPYVIPQKVVS